MYVETRQGHGRNVDTWAKKGLTTSSQRFNYDYSEAELAEIAQTVATLARKVPVTHVVLNNNHEDQGQRNARTLTGLLRQRKA